MTLADSRPNRLANEKSPYLLQHAYNPVDWYPWGDEAFEAARRDNKPIFLSIGYSTCHWCHVMEHESFEDASIADLMNKHFVCIKVDREERPDVDRIYMSAVQVMTGSGGWPLSVFLTPDLKPFYGGTYFPPKDAHGRPGFPAVLDRISEVWRNEPGKLTESGENLLAILRQDVAGDSHTGEIDDSIAKKTFHQLASQFDPRYGGFGNGPKFPRPVVMNFLFRYYYRTKTAEALSMSLESLKAMARGGMYDHLGGGFHRYSVDAQWRVPHFEKMLYDQAQLVCSYLDAYQITHDSFYSRIAEETLEYVLRDMTDSRGGFYSAEDADSPDPENALHLTEGAFYLWSKREVEKTLPPREAEVFCHHFSVDEYGNALADPQGEFKGMNILFTPFTLAETAGHLSMSEHDVENMVADAKRTLFEARSKRPRPFRDDKIITGWNGLMISAFARASRILKQPRYAEAAANAASFIKQSLYDRPTKTLRRRFREGEAKFEAQLDDYAFLIQGLIDLYEATFNIAWLESALELQRTQSAIFWDSAAGGFFDFSGEDKTVLIRTKEFYDGAEPSGNSVAAWNLLRLSEMGGEKTMKKNAETTLRCFRTALERLPQSMPQMAAAMGFYFDAPRQIVIADGGEIGGAQDFVNEIAFRFLPHTIILRADGGAAQRFLAEHLPFIASMTRMNGRTTAYVCENHTCNLPVNEIGQLRLLLEAK